MIESKIQKKCRKFLHSRHFYRITGIKLSIGISAKKKKRFRWLRAKSKSRKTIKKFRAQWGRD